MSTNISLPSSLGIDSSSISHDVYSMGMQIPVDPELHVTQAESIRALSCNVLELEKGCLSLVGGHEVNGDRTAKKIKTCRERQKGEQREKASGWHSSPCGQL